jgi:hypothetical protein
MKPGNPIDRYSIPVFDISARPHLALHCSERQGVIKQIKVGPGPDGIMYDDPDDKIILTSHSRPNETILPLPHLIK